MDEWLTSVERLVLTLSSSGKGKMFTWGNFSHIIILLLWFLNYNTILWQIVWMINILVLYVLYV